MSKENPHRRVGVGSALNLREKNCFFFYFRSPTQLRRSGLKGMGNRVDVANICIFMNVFFYGTYCSFLYFG